MQLFPAREAVCVCKLIANDKLACELIWNCLIEKHLECCWKSNQIVHRKALKSAFTASARYLWFLVIFPAWIASLDVCFHMRFCNEADFIAFELSLRLCQCPIRVSMIASLSANKSCLCFLEDFVTFRKISFWNSISDSAPFMLLTFSRFRWSETRN